MVDLVTMQVKLRVWLKYSAPEKIKAVSLGTLNTTKCTNINSELLNLHS